jgi:hypothetical protein
MHIYELGLIEVSSGQDWFLEGYPLISPDDILDMTAGFTRNEHMPDTSGEKQERDYICHPWYAER